MRVINSDNKTVYYKFLKDVDPPHLRKFTHYKKGLGVYTAIDIKKNDFICKYAGQLNNNAGELEKLDGVDTTYMYFFDYMQGRHCIDATKDDGRVGRLINHSKTPNTRPVLALVDNIPTILIFADRKINKNTELLFDYKEDRKSVILNPENVWLKSKDKPLDL